MAKMKHLLRKFHIGTDNNPHNNHHVAAARTPLIHSTSSPSPSSSPSESSSSASSPSPGGTGAMSQERTVDLSDRSSSQATPQEGSSSNASPNDFSLYEEEFQVQLALALSASDSYRPKDPESDQINAARQLSLGWPLSVADNQKLGGFLSLKYWNYNAVHYDEKVADGFYDVCATTSYSISHKKLPVLADLQAITNLDTVDCDIILVNRAIDPQLRSLEDIAYAMSTECRVMGHGLLFNGLIQKIADLVVDRMGGPVGDVGEMTNRWRVKSDKLRDSLDTVVFPLGLLDVGLSRHRALLFKVLADKLNLPCMLVKGSLYTGSDDGAVNLVKTGEGSEYIIDLMGAPGALIPAEIPSSLLLDTVVEAKGSAYNNETFKDLSLVLDTVAATEEINPHFEEVPSVCRPSLEAFSSYGAQPSGNKEFFDRKADGYVLEKHGLLDYSVNLNLSSFSEELSPAQEKKVKDVSKYVISAAKNPEFAQKLHAVLLESGASPPPDLFSDMNRDTLAKTKLVDQMPPKRGNQNIADMYWSNNELSLLPPSGAQPLNATSCDVKLEENAYEKPASPRLQLALNLNSQSSSEPTGKGICILSAEPNKVIPYGGTVEFSNRILQSGYNFNGNPGMIMVDKELCKPSATDLVGAAYGRIIGSKEQNEDASVVHEKEINPLLGEVAEWEIPWEDLHIGDRIGIGSYGEVYHGDWNGTEVAVKKFLVQDFTSDVLVQFKCEAELMIRLRHPNVVLFMGAVTRPPNLSILTEFLPRGSLYKLMHRSNVHISEKRRMKMVLDVAKGMNYLHTSHPTIVHRDLKTPNLLVDKNWVVKVCDFGMSRLKHHTFLSSKSTAGTPEWMAPEVLRNEPSDEKCDVYSFGVILWELATLRIPWTGLSSMQVVGAVGFQNKRLEVPKEVDSAVAQIIHDCWENDPSLRPSFSQLITRLRGLKCLIRSN
ncbi:hypothetical protein V2J09_022931 [Rumex salicifolius]